MKIPFFGGSKYVIPVLEKLKDRTSLVITTEKEKDEPVINYSINNNIPYLSISSFNEDLKSYILNLTYIISHFIKNCNMGCNQLSSWHLPSVPA